ncbi:MAG: AAA family ATPase [Clostridia bacterium]|nr:AAA family ATPase [Clostridia bacterium]
MDDTISALIPYKGNANYFDTITRRQKESNFYYGAADQQSNKVGIVLYWTKNGDEFEYGLEKLDLAGAEKRCKSIIKGLIKIQDLAKEIDAKDFESYRKFFSDIKNYFTVDNTQCRQSFVTKDAGILKSWVFKYLNILFPDKFCSFYSYAWFEKVEKALGLVSVSSYYERFFNINNALNQIVTNTKLDKSVVYRIFCEELENGSEGTNESGGLINNTSKTIEENTLVALVKNYPLNQILYGPPGTGKTYNSIIYAVAICENKKIEEIKKEKYQEVLERFNLYKVEGRIEFATFHQSYGYEEFIQGIKPYTNNGQIGYRVESGVFKEFCDKAKDKQENFVFIIDEINRGNVSKILGELITLIEESKRVGNSEGMTVRLPYKDNNGKDVYFGVPNNVYILGTMNTADRSLVQLDAALRRRFRFIEMMPDYNVLNDKTNVDGVDLKTLLTSINDRITQLIDREHQIGHSYFTKVNSLADLADAFNYEIIPLLQEYFYEDYDGISEVLNGQFIQVSEDKKSYDVNVSIDKDIFKNIYNGTDEEHNDSVSADE